MLSAWLLFGTTQENNLIMVYAFLGVFQYHYTHPCVKRQDKVKSQVRPLRWTNLLTKTPVTVFGFGCHVLKDFKMAK